MKMLIRYLLVLFVVSVLMVSCRGKEIVIDSVEKQLFLEEKRIGCYKDGGEYMVYSPKDHQISYNSRRNNIRFQTDTQDEFYNLKMESMPRTEGVNILGEVSVGSRGEINDFTFVFECSKIENRQIWLWNKENKIGVIIPINK